MRKGYRVSGDADRWQPEPGGRILEGRVIADIVQKQDGVDRSRIKGRDCSGTLYLETHGLLLDFALVGIDCTQADHIERKLGSFEVNAENLLCGHLQLAQSGGVDGERLVADVAGNGITAFEDHDVALFLSSFETRPYVPQTRNYQLVQRDNRRSCL